MSRKNALLVAAGVGIFLYLVVPKVLDFFASEEDRIKKLLYQVQKACRERDISAILEVIDPEFRDSEGHTKEEIHKILLFIFFQQRRSLEFTYKQISIKLAPNKRTAKVFLLIEGARNRQGEVRLTLRRQRKKWMVWNAQYEVDRWSGF